MSYKNVPLAIHNKWQSALCIDNVKSQALEAVARWSVKTVKLVTLQIVLKAVKWYVIADFRKIHFLSETAVAAWHV